MTNVAPPAFLPPDWRYVGDAWVGDNALTYVVYAVPPVFAADGVTVETAGQPLPLIGYTVDGELLLQQQLPRGPNPSPLPNSAPSSIAGAGSVVDAENGIIALSFDSSQTVVLRRQNLSVWPENGTPDPSLALIIAQPRLIDANGNPVTVGLQPIFVF